MFRRILVLLVGFAFVPSLASAQGAKSGKGSLVRSNPDISLNILMLGRTGGEEKEVEGEEEEEVPNGFNLQEVELRFSSNVDAYFRADAVLALEQEDGEFIFEPEEVFVETLSIPNLTIRAGKFYALVGRHNNLHTHSYPFIDQPLPNEIILGEEGLNETGLSFSYLFPSEWYFEAVAQVFSAKNELLFNSEDQDDLASIFSFKSLLELSESSTMEVNLTYGSGNNEFDEKSQLYAASLTYKHKPVSRSAYSGFLWTAEYLLSDVTQEDSTEKSTKGYASWIQWRFSKRWWVQGRGEYVSFADEADNGDDSTSKLSGLLAFVPTEYSAVRLQYDKLDEAGKEDADHRFSLQWNISIGTHPAHSY